MESVFVYVCSKAQGRLPERVNRLSLLRRGVVGETASAAADDGGSVVDDRRLFSARMSSRLTLCE